VNDGDRLEQMSAVKVAQTEWRVIGELCEAAETRSAALAAVSKHFDVPVSLAQIMTSLQFRSLDAESRASVETMIERRREP